MDRFATSQPAAFGGFIADGYLATLIGAVVGVFGGGRLLLLITEDWEPGFDGADLVVILGSFVLVIVAVFAALRIGRHGAAGTTSFAAGPLYFLSFFVPFGIGILVFFASLFVARRYLIQES